MKALATLAALLLTASAVAAQSELGAALPRADVQAAVGWQNLRGQPSIYGNNWINAIVFADAAAGWYWTEHLRTQVDAGIGSTGRQYRATQIPVGRAFAYALTDTRIRPATFAVSQQYQFFHNAMFHPHVGAGLLIRSERILQRTDPVSVYDADSAGSTVIEPAHTEDGTRREVRPFADLGFKAYVTERAFFITDARFTVRRDLDSILFRFGFGIDF